MQVAWALSENLKSGQIDSNQLKNIAPIWGPYSTWNDYRTDNVICHDNKKAKELISRAFHAIFNLYLPKSSYIELGRPQGVKLYEGDFKDPLIDLKEDIVTLNLTSQNYEVVLMYGWDLSPVDENEDKIVQHKAKTYRNNIATIIKSNPNIQYVLVDYNGKLAKDFKDLENLSQDTMSSVKELLL